MTRKEPVSKQADLRHLFVEHRDRQSRHNRLELMRTSTRTAIGDAPLTGSFYWVPAPNKLARVAWSIEEFFDLWLPNSDHVYVWGHVRDYLELIWQRSLKKIDYACLPRGRVSKTITGRSETDEIVIYHGGDCPIVNGLNIVRKQFNLAKSCRAQFDEHEQCIAGQPDALSQTIGYDLGVKGVDASELDYEN